MNILGISVLNALVKISIKIPSNILSFIPTKTNDKI